MTGSKWHPSFVYNKNIIWFILSILTFKAGYQWGQALKETRMIVCDDVKSEREELVRGIKATWLDAVIDEAASGQEVLWKLEKDPDYDFVFLDIYMDGMDGIETGRKIRESYPDVRLVFISSSREFGPEAFELNAVYYLVKPYRMELLAEIRNRCSPQDEREILLYDVGSRQEQRILCRKIDYIESAHNYMFVHLVTGTELKVRKSMQEIESELGERFLRINRGIIVNMDAVDRMNYDSCEISGMTFMLSRQQRVECRRKYNDYIFGRYMNDEGN